jgi:hypothetical protein
MLAELLLDGFYYQVGQALHVVGEMHFHLVDNVLDRFYLGLLE